MILIGLAAVVGAIAAIPKELWIGIGVLIAGYFVVRWMVKALSTATPPVQTSVEREMIGKPRASSRTQGITAPPPMPSYPAPLSPETANLKKTMLERRSLTSPQEPVTVSPPAPAGMRAYAIPAAPPAMATEVRWIPPGQRCEILGFSIPIGMLYVGPGPQSYYGADPALIDTRLPVAKQPVDVSLKLTDYWPSYSSLSPDARRAYLQWLSDSRITTEANIGYVFLCFYGLERRALVDARASAEARAEIPAIESEIRRLLSIYGSNNSFQGYATSLLEFLSLITVPDSIYRHAPPCFDEPAYELPIRLRLALGQMARDGEPVYADWALAWALTDARIPRRTPVRRCPEQFALLFKQKYTAAHGLGMRLRVNRTMLKAVYRPASPGLRGQEFATDFPRVPDVSAVTAPLDKLRQIVDACSDELDGYSRFIGRSPDKVGSLEALLQLPPSLWPSESRAELADIKARVGDGIVVMSFGELSGRLKSAGTLTRDKVVGFARALESEHLGLEPDVLAGAKTPKPESTVVLFATHPEDGAVRSTPAYQAAAVTLDLACAVALADGEASASELLHLAQHINSWSHVSAAHQKRLKAHLRLQVTQPTSLAEIKKKLDPLSAEAKRAIARFLSHLAQVDGVVTPQEVKLLEKVYKTLGIEEQQAYSDLHAAVPGKAAVPLPTQPAGGFKFDPARIAALQAETRQVSTLLAGVFAEDEPADMPDEVQTDKAPETGAPPMLGLDSEHSAFVRMLISRPRWARQELADLAADMELMLDGVLERINEAAFDTHDAALTEGEDPVELNQDLLVALTP